MWLGAKSFSYQARWRGFRERPETPFKRPDWGRPSPCRGFGGSVPEAGFS